MTIFKLRYSVQDISIKEDNLEFSYKAIHDIIIRILKPDDNYVNNSGNRRQVICEAELSIEPKANISEMLNKIIVGNIVKNTENLPTPYTEMKNHFGEPIIIPSLSSFPENFKTFINQISDELTEAIKRSITTIRWYTHHRGKHSPFGFLNFTWTNDNINWYPVPASIYVSIETIPSRIQLGKKDKDVVFNLINSDNIEPVYHSLFREAWEQRGQNPRSSIILAMSAVEVSVKHLIEKTIPDATWLVTKLQSPSVYLIFKEYLPQLNINNKINGVKILPSESMIENLKKWVTKRNEITHLGKKPLTREKLEEMLLTIKDILHIIDFNCGHEWAIRHIRESSLQSIGYQRL